MVGWWAQAPGGGYIVQRLLATRSEKHAFYAVLWFNLCHYVLRSWPWIIVGVLSMIYFPDLADPEKAYPHMISRFLPVGLKGIMVTSLLAAFMSTIDTHLNLGTSYFINDVYRPYIRKDQDRKHYIRASRIAMVCLLVTATFIASKLTSILGVYKYIGLVESGVCLVMILRWYWWKVSPVSEISALAVSIVVGNFLQWYPGTSGDGLYAVRVLINLSVTTIVWISMTLYFNRAPADQAVAFYRKMRIGGPGWKKISRETGIPPLDSNLILSLKAWIASVFTLYSLLVFIGKILLHQWTGALTALICALAGIWIIRKLIAGFKFS
jgi:SSS family solute:Na+ symporter